MPLREAMWGQEYPNLTGRHGGDEPQPPPVQARFLIGEIREDGQFDIISQTTEVPGDAWTDFLPESAVTDKRLAGTGLRDV